MEIGMILFCLVIAGVAFLLSYRQFREKGILLNNAYLFASEEERSKMDKRPHFRQSGVVFGAIGLIFMLNAAEVVTKSQGLFWIIVMICVIMVVYAIVSSIWIEMKH